MLSWCFWNYRRNCFHIGSRTTKWPTIFTFGVANCKATKCVTHIYLVAQRTDFGIQVARHVHSDYRPGEFFARVGELNRKYSPGLTVLEKTVATWSLTVMSSVVTPLYWSVKEVMPPEQTPHSVMAGQSHSWPKESTATNGATTKSDALISATKPRKIMT